MNFASQPSNLGQIQGPLIISGGDSPYVPRVGNPLMLPHESNPPEFVVPSGLSIDASSLLVLEYNQVDMAIFNHSDAKGTAEATITPNQFSGLGMVRDLAVSGSGPFSGISYGGFEVLTFNFGEEDNILHINDTSEAIHIVNLDSTNRASDDYVAVHALSGPMLINGGHGFDIVNVSSAEDRKLDAIQALLMFDGGDDNSTDILFVESSENDVLNLTRLLVEMESMEVSHEISENDVNPVLPRESYLVVLRDATAGHFSFTLNDPLTDFHRDTANIPYPPTVAQIEYAINMALLQDQVSCGSSETSQCAPAAKVWQLGSSQTYFIAFVGERLNANVTLNLNGDDLENFSTEIFLNTTNNVIRKISDIAYTNIDDLIVNMKSQSDIVVNGKQAAFTIP